MFLRAIRQIKKPRIIHLKGLQTSLEAPFRIKYVVLALSLNKPALESQAQLTTSKNPCNISCKKMTWKSLFCCICITSVLLFD